MKSQAFNPYLPSYEYIPDGEPHVFGDRVYIYGSHDRFNGANFCLNNYICYSASIYDLTNWRNEGIIYRKEQDPRNQNIPMDAPPPKRGFAAFEEPHKNDLNPAGIHAMYAPDVVQGPDGRFYLYYCLDVLPEIAVAVCDEPSGAYQFLGFVRHEDGTILGQGKSDFFQFDPGIFVDDDGTIYLYSGNGPIRANQPCENLASQVMTLKADMLTLNSAPVKLLPSLHESIGTDFDGHAFFEASSIRKANGLYYLIYSSVNSHELCYAISDKPDCNYRYGGTLIDIGDVFLNGRTAKDAVNVLGNTHGGIECINGQWYVFYHRHTNRSCYSRQGCAEKIQFEADGSIHQAEVTSCGLNAGPLEGIGSYPAYICCHLTGANGIPFSHPLAMKMDYPFLTQDCDDIEHEDAATTPVQYISNIQNGAVIGYKYFNFRSAKQISIKIRGTAEGRFFVASTIGGNVLGEIPISISSNNWDDFYGTINISEGVHPLYFRFEGSGAVDLRSFTILNN